MPHTEAVSHALSHENRADHPVVLRLQRQVANGFVLYANYKHYHRQTYGPLFSELHRMFDEFAKDVIETIDDMTERIRMIGQDVQNIQLQQMQEAANVHSAGRDQSCREMVEEAERQPPARY